MTAEERERMNWLCSRIADEKNPSVFHELLRELNELMEKKRQRIHEHTSKSS
jgi:protein-tyrosine phosphatase